MSVGVGMGAHSTENVYASHHVTVAGSKVIPLAPALISLHPHGSQVFAAVGGSIRAFNFRSGCAVSFLDASGKPLSVPHADAIRSVCVDRAGRHVASAGDDKVVRLWSQNDGESDVWLCIHQENVPKRVSAMCFSSDGRWLLLADKFGLVHVIDVIRAGKCLAWSALGGDATGMREGMESARPLMGHTCSIINCLTVSPDNRFIATGDRDGKIRVGVCLPLSPIGGRA